MALAPDNIGRSDHWFEIVSSVFLFGFDFRQVVSWFCRKRDILEIVCIILKINIALLIFHLYALYKVIQLSIFIENHADTFSFRVHIICFLLLKKFRESDCTLQYPSSNVLLTVKCIGCRMELIKY